MLLASIIENDVSAFDTEDWPATALNVSCNDVPDKAALLAATSFKTLR